MDELEFQRQLNALLETIRGMPKGPMKESLVTQASQVQDRHDKSKAVIDKMQAALDVLRVHIQYLLFDLEATKRENAQMRQIIDEGGLEDG